MPSLPQVNTTWCQSSSVTESLAERTKWLAVVLCRRTSTAPASDQMVRWPPVSKVFESFENRPWRSLMSSGLNHSCTVPSSSAKAAL